MKKIGSLYKSYMIRPILYKCVTRAAIAVTALLLWEKYVNTAGRLSLFRDGFLVAGICFLGLAWFSYLRLDGVTIHHMLEEKKKKKPVRGSYADIVDFADEHIVSCEEMTKDERTGCSLAANIICGILFLIPALFALL